MSKQARTPAEISAMVEAGIARGLNVIDAFSAATGNRTLNRAHKKELATQKSARRKYRARLDSFRFGAVAGGGIAIAGGTVAIELELRAVVYHYWWCRDLADEHSPLASLGPGPCRSRLGCSCHPVASRGDRARLR